MPLLWRLYYGDGSTFDNLQGSWLTAPQLNLQAVTHSPDPVFGRFINFGWNWYHALGDLTDANADITIAFTNELTDLAIVFTDWNTKKQLEDKLALNAAVKFGQFMENAAFNAIVETAALDPDFPRISPRRRSGDLIANP